MPGAEAIDASVLVPVLNEEAHLPAVAPAILGQRFDGGLEFLFIDGGSIDGTVDEVERLAQSDPRVRLLRNPRRHTPAALNIGLREARGRYVVRMDAHARYPNGYVAAGIARLQRGDVDHVSGPQVPAGYDEGSRRIALALGSRLGGGGAAYRRATEECDVDTGFLGVWERQRLLELGGWDEGAVINQDAELAARLRSAGGRLVCIPEMAADYLPRNTLRGLARQYYRYGRYRARTGVLHSHAMRKGHLLPPGLVVAALAAAGAPRSLRSLGRCALAAYAAAVVGESVRVAATQSGARPVDSAALPAVFATMHFAWGSGMLVGACQFGAAARNSETISRPARAAV